MPSFPFNDLPTEMRKKVVLHTLPTVTIPFRYWYSAIGRFYDYYEEQTFLNIQDSSPDIAALSDQVRCLKAIEPEEEFPVISIAGVAFRLDPVHDTFKAVDMCLPALRPSAAWNPQKVEGYHRYALPLENILNVALTTYLPRGQAPPDDDGSDIAGPSTAPAAPVPETYYNMAFEKDLPVFARLPKAKHLSLIVENAGREWHIDGFQMYGPDIVGPRLHGNRWGARRVGEHSTEAEEYFLSRRIRADTGMRWDFPNHCDYLSDPEDGSTVSATDARSCRPNIGFYGYSRGNISLGGQWAGFRLWASNNKVEFSPLSWAEVEPLIGEYYSIEERGYYTCHPGFVARVWIIRSKKDAEQSDQPHHHWIEVKEPGFGDPEWVEQIAATWKMTRHMLSHVRGGPSIEQDDESNVALGNYCLQMEPVE